MINIRKYYNSYTIINISPVLNVITHRPNMNPKTSITKNNKSQAPKPKMNEFKLAKINHREIQNI